MEKGKAISDKENPQSKGAFLTPEEKKRLVEFFTLLVEIDQRNKRKNNEAETI